MELWSLKHLSFDTFHTSAGSGDLDFKSGAKRTHFEPECCCWIDGKLESVASLEQLTVDMWQDLTLDKQYAPHKSNSQIHNASNQGQFLVKKISIKLHNFWFRVCLFLIKHVDFTKARLCVNIWLHDAIVQRTFVSKTYRQMFTHVCKESMCN